MTNPIPFLRQTALIEAVSFIVLLGVAMPLKYLAEQPMAVTMVGWIHGVLFILFSIALARAWRVAQWPISRCAIVFIVALLPFGPFLYDKRLLAFVREFEEAQNPRNSSAAESSSDGGT